MVEHLLYTQDVIGSNPVPPTTTNRRNLLGVNEPDSTTPADVLDARGLRCPLPVLRTRQRLKRLPSGARLDVISDDPLARLDMQAFCAQEGHQYLGEREAPGGAWRMALRKADPAAHA